MGYKISKNLPYQLLFAACVGVTYLNNYELTFIVWIFTLAVSLRTQYSLTLFKYIMSFAAIIIISIVTYFFYDNSLYESIRDFTYLIKPIIGLLIGYQLCRNLKINPFETIIYTGILIASVHLSIIGYNVVAHKVINIHVLRAYGGFFSDFEIYALMFVIFHKELQLNYNRRKYLILLAILAISSFLYLSRINFIQFAVLFIGMKGYYALTRKSITIFLISAILVGIGYSIVYNMSLSRNGHGMEAFLFKIKNAPIEAFKTKVNKDDYEDFNDNYRSFENITTVRQVSQEGTDGILFGKGIGATIDIGRRMHTNEDTYVRHQPVLHNAYMTVFLKSGLVGVLFMFYFLFLILRQRNSDIAIVKQVNLIMISTGVYLLFANWVLLGLFLKLDNKAIIIGFLLCYREMVVRQNRIESSSTYAEN